MSGSLVRSFDNTATTTYEQQFDLLARSLEEAVAAYTALHKDDPSAPQLFTQRHDTPYCSQMISIYCDGREDAIANIGLTKPEATRDGAEPLFGRIDYELSRNSAGSSTTHEAHVLGGFNAINIAFLSYLGGIPESQPEAELVNRGPVLSALASVA